MEDVPGCILKFSSLWQCHAWIFPASSPWGRCVVLGCKTHNKVPSPVLDCHPQELFAFTLVHTQPPASHPNYLEVSPPLYVSRGFCSRWGGLDCDSGFFCLSRFGDGSLPWDFSLWCIQKVFEFVFFTFIFFFSHREDENENFQGLHLVVLKPEAPKTVSETHSKHCF